MSKELLFGDDARKKLEQGVKKIASAVKSSWLTTSNVDSEIEDYIDALTTALTPVSPSEPGE